MLLSISLLKDDWISLVLFSILMLLALNNYLFPKRFSSLLRLTVDKSYFAIYIKDTPIVINVFNAIFLVVNLLTYSAVAYFVVLEFYVDVSASYDFYFFLQIMVLFLVYFILKFIIKFIINTILLNQKNSLEFSFYKIGFRNVLSVLMLFFLILHQYSLFNSYYTLLLLVLVFTTFYLYGYVVASFQIVNKKDHTIFHIILYLCTLEIVPMIIYVKLVMLFIYGDIYNL